jgi:DNA-binding CsgD family transcriptional regulator
MVLGAAGATVPASEAAEEALAAGHPMPLFSAIGLRLAGESALRDGWGQPDAWLTAAEHTFAALGHSPPAAACRDLLRQAGRRVARPRAVDAAVPATLRDAGVTAREYEVLRLAAQRHTNAEIAARLYVSPRTVEKHIASLLAKTGATSRRDLADIAPGDGPAAEHGG